MPSIEANPDRLQEGQGQQQQLAAAMVEVAGLVAQASAQVAGAAGHAGAGAAAGAFGPAWGSAIGRDAGEVQSSAVNLGAAAAAYRETDESQMRG